MQSTVAILVAHLSQNFTMTASFADPQPCEFFRRRLQSIRSLILSWLTEVGGLRAGLPRRRRGTRAGALHPVRWQRMHSVLQAPLPLVLLPFGSGCWRMITDSGLQGGCQLCKLGGKHCAYDDPRGCWRVGWRRGKPPPVAVKVRAIRSLAPSWQQPAGTACLVDRENLNRNGYCAAHRILASGMAIRRTAPSTGPFSRWNFAPTTRRT